ncbi:YkgJ family cysteine cluster protein [Methanococcoides sp. FTZ1]|uniref:YkgJ family cysteine cluster protein n=1 Tax=Methanococcoides sp. FTZ1 TaxID=3439061 RepID=UPI003F8784F9
MFPPSKIRQSPQVQYIKKILKYYVCPSECEAFCCKIQPIDIDVADWNLIKKIAPDKTEGFEKREDHGRECYRMEYPCTLLSEDDKCIVYNRRPIPCRLYPFKYDENSSQMSIYPCMIGVKICSDYFDYLRNTGDYVSDAQYENLKASQDEFYIDVDGDDDPNVHLIGIPFGDIPRFSKYLNAKYR